MEKGKTAIIIGATGLIGNHLVNMILSDTFFNKIVVLVRRATNIHNEKLIEHIVDFNDQDSYKHLVRGDVLFSCMGTTLKKAGSKDAQWKIDFTYQYEVAQAARNNGVETMVLVSSSGANPKSRLFYPKMKGELEESVKKLEFPNYMIFQPSLLVGERNEVRVGEKIGEKLGDVLTKLPGLKKYKPIEGEEVAKAMQNAYKMGKYSGEKVFVLDEIFDLL